MIFEAIANGLMVLWLYWLIVILDSKNQLPLGKFIVYIFLLTSLYTVLDQYGVKISFILTLCMVFVVYSLINLSFKLELMVDIVMAIVIQVFITIWISITTTVILVNIMDQMFLMIGVQIFLNVIFYLMYYMKLIPDKWNKIYQSSRKGIGIASVSLIFFVNIVLHYWTYENDLFWEYRKIIVPLFGLVCVLGMMILYNILSRYSQKRELLLHEEYNSYLEDMLDQISKRKHEYQNQINTIMGIINTQSVDLAAPSVLEYCAVIIDKNQEKEKQSLIKGPGIVAAIIHRKMLQAEQEGIRFDHIIAEPFPIFPITAYQLEELLNNLLNNAFEHVSQMAEERREVSLIITKHKIEVSNPVDGYKDVSAIKRSGSTKGYERGYGLSNIKDIAEKAKADFEVYLNNESISFVISFIE